MPTGSTLIVFISTALVLAAMPGPGLLYVAGRTLGGGRTDGLASCCGSALGGVVHVAAGAVGLSAIIMASAEAFLAIKLVGGAYLIYLGVQTWRSAREFAELRVEQGGQNPWAAFRQGVVVEATNPKTAAFFLALLPQFIDPAQGVAGQFLILGSTSIALNTLMAVLVTCVVAALRERALRNSTLIIQLRRLSATLLGGLGAWLLLSGKPE